MEEPLGHIEPLSALLRLGGAYGDPWTWAAVLRYDSPFKVEVEGVDRAPSPSEWRAALKVLRAHGVTEVYFHRAGDSKHHKVV
jgi:hypothetical protein